MDGGSVANSQSRPSAWAVLILDIIFVVVVIDRWSCGFVPSVAYVVDVPCGGGLAAPFINYFAVSGNRTGCDQVAEMGS